MYELYVMPLKEYWTEEDAAEGAENVSQLQKELSELFNADITWDEPDSVSTDGNDEIDVAGFSDVQFDALQAVAAVLEMGKSIDDLSIDLDGAVDPDIFQDFAEYADENDIKRFPQLLWLGRSMESFIIPPDFKQVVEIGNDDDCCCEDEECSCGCGDEDCCCEDDQDNIDVASLPAIRRELDDLGKVLSLKSGLTLDDIENEEFDGDDRLREAKIAWYILSARVDEAINSKLPVVMRFTDEDEDELEEEDDQD